MKQTHYKLKQEMEEKRRQDKEATETKIQQEKEAIERKLQILLKAIVNQNTANLDVEALQALISAPTTDAPNDNEKINNDDIEEEMQDHGEEEEEEEEEEELDVYV
ncbi:bromodomain-containing protein DDB_G0278469-like isoform X4 [Trifolium pratense]|uniref:bromodomain-containing protein DDB_G0278469-like isoform X4 n=1 Tax=Trifolium pratense TaxID=57577 RepID=UPI001E694CF2|nr:bromodomain-containing protein DDB_G0278469-like isoform X4 [Trifolium pratense]XP_045811360.1 bromodomain-containing protein DDB_G0278469-like isoform X4 [Trifolium pratense]XP_045811366.1 bromodomain-containing protein DDB_G0278469-like isoform X4 [Trifolium pratense]